MSNNSSRPSKEPLADVFQKSVSPYSKALSLHPHLYGGELYHRASELKALDRLVGQLKEVAEQVKGYNYKNLPPILEAIKDALSGKPKLSWWSLVTISIGQAFAQEENDEEKNALEKQYLSELSSVLTEMIRNYQSTNTKLLLQIRLTALDIDSRLVELEQIPGCTKEASETLEYLSSEFNLINRELDNLIDSPDLQLKGNLSHFLPLVKKMNQILKIVSGLADNNPEAYRLFCRKDHLQNISAKFVKVIGSSHLINDPSQMSFWDEINILSIFELITYLPQVQNAISFSELVSLLVHLEELFVNNPSPDKQRPPLFSSPFLKQMALFKDVEFSQQAEKIKAAAKGKGDRPLPKDLVDFYRTRLMEENDLHSLCAMLRYKADDFPPSGKNPSQIQRDTLQRMRIISNSSQPRDLDTVLKSFTTDEMATRYYLLQEVILEQFIYWRKHGIF